jgi:hypothetical protein
MDKPVEITPEAIEAGFEKEGFVCKGEIATNLYLSETLGQPLASRRAVPGAGGKRHPLTRGGSGNCREVGFVSLMLLAESHNWLKMEELAYCSRLGRTHSLPIGIRRLEGDPTACERMR